MTKKKPSTPTGLEMGGRRLWREIVGAYDLRPDELLLLAEAARTVDIIDRMQDALTSTELLAPGSKGQDRPHPLLTEIRGHRVVLAAFLKQMKLPDVDPARSTAEAQARTTQARHAAHARWTVRH